MRLSRAGLAGIAAVTTALAGAAQAQASAANASAVYRCPGPPVLYTDSISVAEAREKGCRTIEGTPITVIQAQRPRPPAPAPAPQAGGSRGSDARVDPGQQRARDSDARRILEAELHRDEGELASLQKEYNGGEPERRGDERNFQKYTDRVAELKTAIARKEGDIAALKRELAKLPP